MSTRDERNALSPEAEALIDNGLGFLEKARSELDSGEYRYAVVSFWTAVELLLKVPLVQEHWTLVCTGKKIARKDYLTGDFQSVTYSETLERLGNILETPLSKETAAIFDRVRRHRNRVVHFYHDGFTSAERDVILAEQADAWFALNRLLRDEWKALFNGRLATRLARNETVLLAGNRFYAAVKYRHITDRLDDFRWLGVKITRCTGCEQDARVHRIAEGSGRLPLMYTTCHVCTFFSRYVQVTCPGCGHVTEMQQGDEGYSCPQCGEKKERYALLDEWSGSPEKLQYLPSPAGCYYCNQPDIVCQYGTGHLCTECFALTGSLEYCPYCHHANNVVDEFVHGLGCSACDGPGEGDLISTER